MERNYDTYLKYTQKYKIFLEEPLIFIDESNSKKAKRAGRPVLSFLESSQRVQKNKVNTMIDHSSPNLLKAVSYKKMAPEYADFKKVSKNFDDFLENLSKLKVFLEVRKMKKFCQNILLHWSVSFIYRKKSIKFSLNFSLII